MKNQLSDEFKSMLDEDTEFEMSRAKAQIDYAMEGEEEHFSVTLLSALLDWMIDYYEDKETVKEIVKELL